MHDLIENLPVAIYESTIHEDGRVTIDFVSESCSRILGVPHNELLTDNNVYKKIIHPDDLLVFQRKLQDAHSGGSEFDAQVRIVVDGAVRWVEINSSHQALANGGFKRRGIIQDITQRKTSHEEELLRYRSLEARSKKNETLLEQLFQTIPMAVVLLTGNGKVSQVNKGFEEMFGYTLDELRDKSINDFIVPEELAHEGIDLHNVVASNHVILRETVRLHRSGRPLNVLLYGMPVKFDSQTIGIYGVYIDITTRKRIEEELKIRNAELDNFVYKVSHDLRAPLSSILGLVNLAKLPGNTDNPIEYIELIGSKVEHLDNFIGDVLSHSKNLKMEVSVAMVDFGKIIDQTFQDLNYLEGAKGISRIERIEGIEFYSDPWRIAEIMRNLISNAIKYRKLDHGASEIGIRVNVDNMRAEINFADNGIGIDEANLTKIFEMFYRATEQSDGSGIGLYIVRNAVEKLGGQISVASRLGQGTRFTIILPNRINSVINVVPKPADILEK
ncbi:PAS domain S-box protein [Chryseolinea sp. T2]|uniref:sensor histidine kinase n=1 Tax=Chryseolinea sp. T2 TaxID=3129255 RepID=UPI003077177F